MGWHTIKISQLLVDDFIDYWCLKIKFYGFNIHIQENTTLHSFNLWSKIINSGKLVIHLWNLIFWVWLRIYAIILFICICKYYAFVPRTSVVSVLNSQLFWSPLVVCLFMMTVLSWQMIAVFTTKIMTQTSGWMNNSSSWALKRLLSLIAHLQDLRELWQMWLEFSIYCKQNTCYHKDEVPTKVVFFFFKVFGMVNKSILCGI